MFRLFCFLLGDGMLQCNSEVNIHDGRMVRGLQLRIIGIRLFPSIGIEIIVAAIFEMISALALSMRSFFIAFFLKVQLFCSIFGAY